MAEPIDPELERSAEAVADQDRPDWEAEAPRRPELRRAVTGLRVMARLANAHFEARRAFRLDVEPAMEPAAGDTDPSLRQPAFQWGFLRALDRIGEGSFGEVWRAWDPSLEREVALKLRRLSPVPEGGPPLARTSDPATRHWLDEARRLASVRHANVLTVYGAAEHEGRAGLWTELVRGESVEERLRREGPFALKEVARIGRDLCHALVVVHAANLVHGDIKAANVMLEPDPGGASPARVVLMDFGAAHVTAGAGRRNVGRVGSTGTPLVMAPEVLGAGPASEASDVYSVGALLFRMATGRYPVEAGSMEALREQHARGERLDLSSLRPGVPSGFARLVHQALARDPSERPTDSELGRALEGFADPGRRRWVPLVAAGAAVAALLVVSFAWMAFHRPNANRYVPPEKLPGPRVEAMRLAGIAEGASRGEQFGNCETGVGDVNGDGFDDFISAGAHYSGERYLQGRVALYLGNRDGKLGAPAWVAYGREAGDYFGAFLGAAGDVNHDGFADVLITDQTPRASDHEEVRSVFLYLGSPTGLRPEPACRIMGWQPHANFGGGITGIGDVNGDGYDDVAIGASNYTHRFPFEGAVFVYLGGPNGLSARPDWAVYGGARDAWLGNVMTRAGDVNHDGYDDLLVGAPGWKGAHTADVGRALLYLGGPHGLAARPSWTAEGDQPRGVMGYFVGGVGDVNQDGFADVMVTQPGWSGRAVREGRALIYLGGPTGLSRDPVWTGQGFSAGSAISTGNAWLGDVNGDGIPDLLYGSGLYSASLERRQLGVAGVYLSPRDPRGTHPAWYKVGDDPGTPIAAWLSAAGDFNGDGLADIIFGQTGWPGGEQRGRVMLYLGQRVTLPR